MCAVRAFASLCAECGEPGLAFSMAAQPTSLPWQMLNPAKLVAGASTLRTSTAFASFFGWDGMKADGDRKTYKSEADRIHLRSKAVKELIVNGADPYKLHADLSWHAWDTAVRLGVVHKHANVGPCAACAAFCPAAYEALKPKVKIGYCKKAKRCPRVQSGMPYAVHRPWRHPSR